MLMTLPMMNLAAPQGFPGGAAVIVTPATANGFFGIPFTVNANQSVTWSSDNTAAATCVAGPDTSTLVTPVGSGGVDIIGDAGGGNSDLCDVTCYAVGASGTKFGWVEPGLGAFQTAGGAAATADGDPVGRLTDQFASGANHFSQTTAGKRSTLQLNEINSIYPALQFDGSDDEYALPAIGNTGTLGAQVIMILKLVSAADQRIMHSNDIAKLNGIIHSVVGTAAGTVALEIYDSVLGFVRFADNLVASAWHKVYLNFTPMGLAAGQTITGDVDGAAVNLTLTSGSADFGTAGLFGGKFTGFGNSFAGMLAFWACSETLGGTATTYVQAKFGVT